MKILYLDIETTGKDYCRHGIHQLAGIIEIDGVVKEQFDFNVQPHVLSKIDDAALEKSRVTWNDLKRYPTIDIIFREFLRIINNHVIPTFPTEKLHISGYNVAAFDILFLQKFFDLNLNNTFYHWFQKPPIDSFVLVAEYCRIHKIENYKWKLHEVAEMLGISIEKENLHNALYDANIARLIHKKISNYEKKTEPQFSL